MRDVGDRMVVVWSTVMLSILAIGLLLNYALEYYNQRLFFIGLSDINGLNQICNMMMDDHRLENYNAMIRIYDCVHNCMHGFSFIL